MKVAVIPARGGSKRIPRKNIKLFCGKPIIAWSIEAALNSNCFDRIIVSTDDLEISEISQQFGADVPFMRPAKLADDHTVTVSVISHATRWLIEHNQAPDFICCIYPTAPLVQPGDIQRGLELLNQTGCDYVFPVTPYSPPIQRAFRIVESGRIEMLQPQHLSTRSQDLETLYHDAGQFYWGTRDAWIGERPIYGVGSVPMVIPRNRTQDIDTTEDWMLAELLFRSRNKLDPLQDKGA